MAPLITIEEFTEICSVAAPFIRVYGFETKEIGHGTSRVIMPAGESHIRPGGSISGPAQMALADFALYAAVLGAIGPVPLAVTTNLSVNFLLKPLPGRLVGEARLMKLGKRLAVGEVNICSEGQNDPCCHVTGTYSIPPR
ncbi:MAG: PaaI family thioesterase [Kiloniellales bacterium]|nr:PaaI family thioesterase [Kiloniellales bacterium]